MSSKDVALRAGVSRSTVSQVLNGHGGRFANDTATRVRQAADALGYRPSAAARTLARGTSDVVVTLLPNVTFGPRLRDLIDALSAGLMARGFTNLLHLSTKDDVIADSILELRPHAVISLGQLPTGRAEQLRRQGVFVVEQTGAVQERIDLAIGRRQAEHLAAHGYTAIAVALPVDLREHRYAPPRAAGVHDWCLRNGVQVLPTLHVDVERGATPDLVRGLPGQARIGIAAYNDEVGLAVLSSAQMSARPVPEAVGIIGVDNSVIARITAPPLTTIDFDLEYSAARMLDLIVRGDAEISSEDLDEVENRLRVIRGGTTRGAKS